jgi:phosphoglycolate phosphatase
MRDTIVFDLDGTIADTAGDLIAAANATLLAMGHAVALCPGDDDATAFRGGRAMLELAVARLELADGERIVKVGFPLFLDAYAREIDTHTTVYPGVVAAIGRLRARGAATAICTNKPENLAIDLIDRLALAQHFDALIGADTLSRSQA